jgi:hypothetical protein
MEHTRTTPEQSVILKKIGYNVPDTHYWLQHLTQGWIEETGYAGEELDHNSDYSWKYTRPKLVDVATWIREVKLWHVSTEPIYMNKACWACVAIPIPTLQIDDIFYADTHDLVLSAGIDFILTKLNEDDFHPTN